MLLPHLSCQPLFGTLPTRRPSKEIRIIRWCYYYKSYYFKQFFQFILIFFFIYILLTSHMHRISFTPSVPTITSKNKFKSPIIYVSWLDFYWWLLLIYAKIFTCLTRTKNEFEMKKNEDWKEIILNYFREREM